MTYNVLAYITTCEVPNKVEQLPQNRRLRRDYLTMIQ